MERLAKGWRIFGRRLVVVMQFVTFYLDTVTQMIYVAQYFGQLLPGSKICQWAWLLIVWAGCPPFTPQFEFNPVSTRPYHLSPTDS